MSDAGTGPTTTPPRPDSRSSASCYYLDIEQDPARAAGARKTITRGPRLPAGADRKVANPYDYARQNFRIYKNGKLGESCSKASSFRTPTKPATGGRAKARDSPRLRPRPCSAAGLVARDATDAFGVRRDLAEFAQNQLDWTLGRNPFDMCLLYGFGVTQSAVAR